MDDNQGITLIELLIVIGIIGILTAIAIPGYLGHQKRATRSEGTTNLENLRLLEEQYFADNGCYYRTGGVCKNDNLNAQDLDKTDPSDGIADIQAFLPGFKPGDDSVLFFEYDLQTIDAGGGNASGFTATATGKANTRVAGEVCTINHNNVKTGPCW